MSHWDLLPVDIQDKIIIIRNDMIQFSQGLFHFNDHNSYCLYFLACFISSILYSSDELQLFPNFKK